MPGRLAAAMGRSGRNRKGLWPFLPVMVDIFRRRYKNIYKQEITVSFQRSLFLFLSAPIRIRYVACRREATIGKKLIHHSTLPCRATFKHYFLMIKPPLELPLRKPGSGTK